MRLFLLWFVLGGCAPGDDGDSSEESLDARGDCNPVDAGGCMFPYPSSIKSQHSSAKVTEGNHTAKR